MRNKSLKNQLKAQFYRGNRLTFGFSVFAALSVGSMALIVSWLMQQLIDAAGPMPCRWARSRGSPGDL